MEIEIHGFVIAIHNIGIHDVTKLTNDILHIDYRLYSESKTKSCLVLKYSFGCKKESISIRSYSLKDDGEYSYVIINLHGSYFDNSPKFNFEELLSFISIFKYTPKQIDIAFNDNNECISVEEIIRWCKRPDEYCVGSLVNRNIPKIVYVKENFYSVQLNSAASKTNYGTIYVRPDTKFIRFEIKFKNKDKILYLLNEYSNENYNQFEKRCLEALLGCINFIRPSSRGKRGKNKNIKLDPWKSFLKSDINKINWRKLKQERGNNRIEADNYNTSKSIKRLASMFQNLIGKASIMIPEKELLNLFSEYSGYIVIKNIPLSGSYHNNI